MNDLYDATLTFQKKGEAYFPAKKINSDVCFVLFFVFIFQAKTKTNKKRKKLIIDRKEIR